MKPIKNDTASRARMSLGHVTTGKRPQPAFCLVYGLPGVGKTTFAAGAPDPIFLCSERGTNQLDVARFPTPESVADVLTALALLAEERHAYKTLAVDSIDWLEPLVSKHTCEANGWRDLEQPGYGKGPSAALEVWREILAAVERVRDAGMHVVAIAHSHTRRVDHPDAEGYDRYELKMNPKAAGLWKEAADEVLFARYDTQVFKTKDGKTKARSSGDRVLRTEWTASYDAKNRHGLPDPMPLSWADYQAALEASGTVGLVAKNESDERRASAFSAASDAIDRAASRDDLKAAFRGFEGSPYLTASQKSELGELAKSRASALRAAAIDAVRGHALVSAAVEVMGAEVVSGEGQAS